MTVYNVLRLLDHEVWAEVVPEDNKGDGLDLMVWSADWIGGSDYPQDLKRFLDWVVDDIRVKVGTDPETHRRTPVLVIPAYEPMKRRRR